MAAVIQGVAVVALLMVLGFVLARTRALPASSVQGLTAVVYWAATPALLFHQLSHTDTRLVLGEPLLVAAVSGLSVAVLYSITMYFCRLSKADIILGGMAGAVTNAAHIGVPIAVYVVGEGGAVAPLMVFQLAFLTPLYFTLADWSASGEKFAPTSFLKMLVTNPMVIAMALGMAVEVLGLNTPALIDNLTSMLGQAAPPLVLLAFGASLVGNKIHLDRKKALAVASSCFAKLILHPLFAFLVGLALGLDHSLLLRVTVMAALPSAQNAFIAASRSGQGIDVARGAVAITSIACLPIIVLIAWSFTLST